MAHELSVPSEMSSNLQENLRKILKEKLVHRQVDRKQLGAFVKDTLNTGWPKVQIQNMVYVSLRERPHKSIQVNAELEGHIKQADLEWRSRLFNSLQKLSVTSGVPVLGPRPSAGCEEVERCWDALGQLLGSEHVCRGEAVYSLAELYQFMVDTAGAWSASQSVGDTSVTEPVNMSLLQLTMQQPNRQELQDIFQELHPSILQADTIVDGHQSFTHKPSGAADYRAVCVIRNGLYALARQVCKMGCPASLRFQLWSMALGMDHQSSEHSMRMQTLRDQVISKMSLLDHVMMKDIHACITDNDSFFVFEDIAYQLALLFLRDPTVQDQPSASPFVPCPGFANYLAPICYLHLEVHLVYAIFVRMYQQFLSPLHSLSCDHNGLLRLCVVFETLLQERSPSLVLHLRAHNLEPLQLVFKWIFYAFAGYLDPDQLLGLWDRIIGFDSLLVVPVLAAAILDFRSANLMQVTALSEAEAVIADLHHIRILPLLQATLFM